MPTVGDSAHVTMVPLDAKGIDPLYQICLNALETFALTAVYPEALPLLWAGII